MNSSRPKEDVLAHYDEESGEIIFLTVPATATAELRAKAFGGVRPTVSELEMLEPTEAFRRVGGTLLALLDLSSTRQQSLAQRFMDDANERDL